jgi:hypothetical protein
MAEDAARELPHLPLEDALQLVHPYAECGSPRYEPGGDALARAFPHRELARPGSFRPIDLLLPVRQSLRQSPPEPVSCGRVGESPCLPAGSCSCRSDLSWRLRTREQTWQPSRDGLGRRSIPRCWDHRAGVFHPPLGAGAAPRLEGRDPAAVTFLSGALK